MKLPPLWPHQDQPVAVNYKIIDGFDGYRIGDDGSVWCRSPINGKGIFWTAWRKKSPSQNGKYGHLRIDLYLGGKRYVRYIHRLVLEAFVGPCPPGMECCHKDSDPTNNKVNNLRWGTHRSNTQDMIRHGRSARGEKNRNAKLTKGTVSSIRSDCDKGDSQRAIAKKYGITQSQVSRIATKKRWGHV